MTISEVKQAYEDIVNLVNTGKSMEAFDKYYSDDVVMQENNLEPMVGKEANRAREMDFFSKVTDFRGAKLVDVAYNENLVIAVWDLDYSHSEWGERVTTQISIQHWKDGKVAKEQFVYSMS
jgi:hypothetical protein